MTRKELLDQCIRTRIDARSHNAMVRERIKRRQYVGSAFMMASYYHETLKEYQRELANLRKERT